MHIVAIAWLFVTILMALTERSVTAGVLTFILYGLAPLTLFWWIVATPKRRARNAVRGDREVSVRVEELSGNPDQQHSRGDQ
jgi:small-conductance mechanosensitive channel